MILLGISLKNWGVTDRKLHGRVDLGHKWVLMVHKLKHISHIKHIGGGIVGGQQREQP